MWNSILTRTDFNFLLLLSAQQLSNLQKLPMRAVFLLLLLLQLHAVGAFRPSRAFRRPLQIASTKTVGGGGDKVRVKLLADVKGTGRKGEIVLVSGAQFINVLSPKKLVERVSDDAMNELAAKKKADEAAELANAQGLAEKLQALGRVAVTRKVGANGQLFGAVTHKQIMELVKGQFPQHFVPGAQFAVTSVKGCDATGANCVQDAGEDLRKTGVYQARLKLHSKVEGLFMFEVVAEK